MRMIGASVRVGKYVTHIYIIALLCNTKLHKPRLVCFPFHRFILDGLEHFRCFLRNCSNLASPLVEHIHQWFGLGELFIVRLVDLM